MNETEKEMAVYSLGATHGSPTMAQSVVDEYGLDAQVLPDYSDYDVTVYKTGDDRFILAGKHSTDAMEWMRDNTRIAFNMHDYRSYMDDRTASRDTFNKMTQRYRDLVQKYGEIDAHMTGHSRGGSMALVSSRELGVRSTVFSPGAGVFSGMRGFICDFIECDDADRTIFRTKGDILSSMIKGNLANNENLKELTPHPGILPHALEQFLPSKKVVKKNRIVGPSMEIPAEKYRKLTKNVHRSVLDQAFCEKYPDRCVNGRMRL